MARRIVAAVEVPTSRRRDVGLHPVPPLGRDVWIESRLVRSPIALLTLGPSWAGWGDAAQGLPLPLPVDLAGALVRVAPPEGTPRDVVGLLEVALRALGAGAVKVLPAPRGKVLTAECFAVDENGGGRWRKGAREVVLEMVSEANSQDAAALRAFVEGVMAEAKL